MVLRSTPFFVCFNAKRLRRVRSVYFYIFKDLSFKRFWWRLVKPQLFVCHLVNPFIQTSFYSSAVSAFCSLSMAEYPIFFIALFKSSTLRELWILTGFFFLRSSILHCKQVHILQSLLLNYSESTQGEYSVLTMLDSKYLGFCHYFKSEMIRETKNSVLKPGWVCSAVGLFLTEAVLANPAVIFA